MKVFLYWLCLYYDVARLYRYLVTANKFVKHNVACLNVKKSILPVTTISHADVT